MDERFAHTRQISLQVAIGDQQFVWNKLSFVKRKKSIYL